MTAGCSTASAQHRPVLLKEVLASLAPAHGRRYIDGTFGRGGVTKALLEAHATIEVIAIDRDPEAIAYGQALTSLHNGRLRLINGRFGDMEALVGGESKPVDGVTLDLGVSSPQFDEAERGFSFRNDGPLDMRMGRDGPSAADLVGTASEQHLANILYHYGEERMARAVARAIVRSRASQPITRTAELAEIVRSVVPRGKNGHDGATRTFQALRIWVNDELGELERGLLAAEHILAPGGRLAVITFHSLEDRQVKAFLRQRSGSLPGTSRHLPPATKELPPTFQLLTRQSVQPSSHEKYINPRARSARLRAAERTLAAPPPPPLPPSSHAPAWPTAGRRL